jgi:integrase
VFRAKIFQPSYTNRSYCIFIEGLKSAVTKAAYTYALEKYMKFLGIQNPDDLLIHQDNPRIIQDQIIDFLILLKNPPHSLRYATRSQYVSAIITFYDLNEVILNRKKIYRYLGEEERPIENRGYNTEEIRKMLEVSDEKVRAILLLLASTGMRIRAVVDLTLQDLQEVPEFKLYKVTVYSDSKERYFTFTTPEAATAITIYLEYRKRYGEKLTSGSPVFRDQFDRNDPASVHNVKPMKLRTIERLISRSLEKSGIRTVERITEFNNDKGKIRKNVRLTAGFRKFFDTQLIYAKVEPRTKELFMGHNIGLDDHYFKPEDDYVLHEYLKAVNNLTINEENRLRKEISDLIRKNNVLENMEIKHNEEIQAIRADMEAKFQQIVAKIDVTKVNQPK